jgi:dTDP-4-amino-4,6-dideoxygalactose transaminase
MKINEIINSIQQQKAFYFYRGRIALYALLKAMGVEEGDEVILQAFTCLAVPNPILWLRAVPVYVDINPNTFNMDVDKLEEKITKKTKVIIVQHTYGIPTDMEKVLAIARKYKLYVIEDACHTLSSKYKGKLVGLFGDASFYSFEWGKPVIIGLGGCAVVNNPDIRSKVENIYPEFIPPSKREVLMVQLEYILHSLLVNPTTFWTIRKIYRMLYKSGILVGTFKKEEYKGIETEDINKKMSDFHKSLLIKKLKNWGKEEEHRIWVASQYEEFLSTTSIMHPILDDNYEPVYLRYPILAKNKEKVLEEAQKRKIELGDWYISPVHPLTNEDLEFVKYKQGECPVAEEISQKIITLPIHKKINEKEIKRITEFLKEMEARNLC